MRSGRRAAVVGAGLAGLWTALRLARRGYEVTVYEMEFPGYGASSRAAGIISLQLPRALLRYAVEGMKEYSGMGMREVPSLWVPRKDMYRCAESVAAELRRLGVVAEPLALKEVDGVLSASDERGVFMFQGLISSGDVVNALYKSLEGSRVSLRTGAVRRKGERLYYDGSPIEADLTFIAAGPWTQRLVDLRLRTYKCSAHSVEVNGLPNLIIEDDENEFYLVPESRGRAIVGGPDSPLEAPEDGFRVDPAEPYEVLEMVSRRVPAAELARPVSSWAAPCASGPDGLPVVGEVDDGLYVITGLDGAGLTLSPALSRLVVDVAEGVADEDPNLSPRRKTGDGPNEPFESICDGV